MAWVTQTFRHEDITIDLFESTVFITARTAIGPESICFDPDGNASDAHAWALMLRRAARRLEEIGKLASPKPYIRPEDDPSRCTYDREAWRKAR